MIATRTLTPDDWRLWRELRLAALTEAPYAFGSVLADWQGEGDREERWRARLGIPGAHDLVALLDGRPVGMASGVPAGGDAVELISMWVSPTARGRGVGDLLITEIARWAAGRRAAELRLAVFTGNDAAVALYRRHGFTDTGEPGEVLPGGVRRETVMVRPPAVGRHGTTPVGPGRGHLSRTSGAAGTRPR